MIIKDYLSEVQVQDLDGGKRVAKALGSHRAIILRNRGLLTVADFLIQKTHPACKSLDKNKSPRTPARGRYFNPIIIEDLKSSMPRWF